LLSVAGGLAGLIASQWITSGLLLFLPFRQRAFYEFALDGRVLVVSLVVTVATALIFGVLPGWRAAREANWRHAGRGSVGTHSARWVKAAMALQLAASLVLILGAALFGRSLQNLVTADYGFDRQGLVTVGWSGSSSIRESEEGHFQRHVALLEQVRSLPQVRAAALADASPLGGHRGGGALHAPGYVPAPGERTTFFWYGDVSPGYFALMGIPILAGRDFDDHDPSANVAIVSESLARRYFGRLDVTGERIGSGWGAGTGRKEVRIVGVVGNTPAKDLRAALQDQDVVYRPFPDLRL